MSKPSVIVKKLLIFLHRWTGVALSALFLMWFFSGIVMMYWDYPGVDRNDTLERGPVLEAAKIKLTPQQALTSLGDGTTADQIRLNTFDGRPVYRFGGRGGEHIVYADTGEEQLDVSLGLIRRVASAWTGQPVSAAKGEIVTEPDQWTVSGSFRVHRPMTKYSWPNGEQVYVSGNTGEVVQYTTTGSRLGAWLGAIPHWIYFTPIRQYQPQWSQFVIWTSGVGTVSGLIGLAVAIWMLSPQRKKYRYAGQPTAVPYRGQKRWHTILGLVFGVTAATWAFSGMMSMGVQLPFLGQRGNRPAALADRRGRDGGNAGIPGALRGRRLRLDAFAAKSPAEALRQLGTLQVKELEFTQFAGQPVYLASSATTNGTSTSIVPVAGEPMVAFGEARIKDVVRKAVKPGELAELRVMDEYDRYYIDRHGRKPLPVVLARLNDADNTRYYIDPKTGRIAGNYSARSFSSRWLYHGLHSLDFPWLYKYRPLWDIVVITLMLGGTALCVTSLILTWQVLWRKVVYWTRARQTRERASELSPAAGD